MLAYIFWHRPYPQTEQKFYEDAIVRFQGELSRHPPPGFIGAASFRIDPVPWLGGLAGYEDWSLHEGSWAMDPLNAFAVAGPVQPSHDGVAAHMAEGHGGLYAHAGGDISRAPHSTIYWLTRPRGIQWQAALDPARAYRAPANGLGSRRRVRRRSPRGFGDRGAFRLAAGLPHQAPASAAIA